MKYAYCCNCEAIREVRHEPLVNVDTTGKFIGGDVVCQVCAWILMVAYRPDALWCCYIPCDRLAEFEIYGESGAPDDVTQACEQHLGALLGSRMVGPTNHSWRVVDLSPSNSTLPAREGETERAKQHLRAVLNDDAQFHGVRLRNISTPARDAARNFLDGLERLAGDFTGDGAYTLDRWKVAPAPEKRTTGGDMNNRYVIDLGAGWREVTKAEWVRVERAAGFNNTMGQPDEPATQVFDGRGIRGAIFRDNSTSLYHVLGTKWADDHRFDAPSSVSSQPFSDTTEANKAAYKVMSKQLPHTYDEIGGIEAKQRTTAYIGVKCPEGHDLCLVSQHPPTPTAQPCERCGGSGQQIVDLPVRFGHGQTTTIETCTARHGSGKSSPNVSGEPCDCPTCHGSGVTPTEKAGEAP